MTHPAPATLQPRQEIAAHFGWIRAYLKCSTNDNWRDMKVLIERQLEKLEKAIEGP